MLDARLHEIENDLTKLKLKLERLQRGSFFIVKNGKYDKWFYYLDGKEIYIPKKNIKLAEELAIRKYFEQMVKKLECEKEAIKAYQKKYNKNTQVELELTSNNSYQKLLSSIFTPLTKELADWTIGKYNTNETFREQCTFNCPSGDMVRSKSEMIIDQVLYTNRIPFHYEEELILPGGEKVYPDFTIRHPQTGEYYYWEHMGLMNNEKYKNKNIFKVSNYMRADILPGKNLIITYESDKYSFDYAEVNRIVHNNFLG